MAKHDWNPRAVELRNLWNDLRRNIYNLDIEDRPHRTLANITWRLKKYPAFLLRRCINRYFQEQKALGTDGEYLVKVSNFFKDGSYFANYLDEDWKLCKPPTKDAK